MAGNRTASRDAGPAATFGDLVVASGYALVAGVALLTGMVYGPLRVLVAAPLLGFLPGYALVAALFPARSVTERDSPRSRWVRGPSAVERFSLAVATSLVLLVLAGIVVSVAGAPFDELTLVATVVALVVLGSVLAAFSRRRTAASDRYVVSVGGLADGVRARAADASTLDAVLNVALAVAVVVAASAFAVGLAAPDRGETDTEVALLTQQGDELVAGNYSTTLEAGATENVTLAVENREGETTNYTAVAVLERVDTSGNDSVVLERSELDRVSVSAADGETVRRQLAVEPTTLGEDLRLNVYVYRGGAPAEASGDTAYRHLYLWVDVEEPGA
ncbi:DUF1616 domain-containing protein [Halobacterium sp. R2-5]|uniref:DUF1616 domain-containing protein n=1 Tax=Halobacterium sp. R2-5 TaxID=2715751 RepID=UPI00142253F7|nr:DUF1616 domain-containing protein [Halobacterium sp. R2-5]NIB98528.1 DUF1616 domain-containing protein [Halobacterium sp. R2-5]